MPRFAWLVAITAFVGCANPFSPSGPTITVSFDAQSSTRAGRVLRGDINGQRVELAANQASTDVRAKQYGRVPMHVTLLTATGDSLAAVAFSHELQHGYQHWVAAVVGSHRPLGLCIGTVAAARATDSADTLFVMYGGTPEGALC